MVQSRKTKEAFEAYDFQQSAGLIHKNRRFEKSKEPTNTRLSALIFVLNGTAK